MQFLYEIYSWMVQYINISPFFSSAMLSPINPNLDLFTYFIWVLGSESYCSKNFNLDCCYLGNCEEQLTSTDFWPTVGW